MSKYLIFLFSLLPNLLLSQTEINLTIWRSGYDTLGNQTMESLDQCPYSVKGIFWNPKDSLNFNGEIIFESTMYESYRHDWIGTIPTNPNLTEDDFLHFSIWFEESCKDYYLKDFFNIQVESGRKRSLFRFFHLLPNSNE